MQRLPAILAIVGLVLMGVPATATTDTLEERNSEWIETKLGTEASPEHPIEVVTDRGSQERSTAWLVETLAKRFADAGVDLSVHEASPSSAETQTPDGFPVASTIAILWEEVVIEGEDDPRRRSLAAADREVECSQGGGEAGGHYDRAEPTPEQARDEVWESAHVGELPAAFPHIEATSWYGAGVYDYVGTATSSLSEKGTGELMTFAPTLRATATDQTVSHETHFTYEDTSIRYTGSSDFWCIQWEDSRSGDFHVLNAPIIDGVVHEAPT